jgi:hypothetical protein
MPISVPHHGADRTDSTTHGVDPKLYLDSHVIKLVEVARKYSGPEVSLQSIWAPYEAQRAPGAGITVY